MVNDGKHLIFRFGYFELREKDHRLLRAGEEIHLQPQVFRLLLYLVHNRDRVVQKDEIVREVWDSAAVTDNSLTRSISLLRKILDDDPRDTRAIRTVSSIGYQFVCAVDQAEDCATSPKLAEVATEESAKLEVPEISAAVSAGNKNRIPRRFQRVWFSAFVIGVLLLLAAGLWYLRLPLPPPRIAAYTQLTHDGFKKSLAGTDGGRLYINQSYENDLFFNSSPPASISQVAILGGGIAQIPVDVPAPELVDVSADGSSLLIFSVLTGDETAKPLWNVRTLGGSARRLGEAADASFSPDGNLVAYSTPGGDIWQVRNDGTGAHKLASPGGFVFGIAWSPDSAIIRFNKDDAIWEMSSSGSNPHPLFPGRERSFRMPTAGGLRTESSSYLWPYPKDNSIGEKYGYSTNGPKCFGRGRNRFNWPEGPPCGAGQSQARTEKPSLRRAKSREASFLALTRIPNSSSPFSGAFPHRARPFRRTASTWPTSPSRNQFSGRPTGTEATRCN